MPILECILIDATTNQIKFTTNDMELGIETIVDGTIEEKGLIALDAKIFYEIIRRLPENQVTIKQTINLLPPLPVKKLNLQFLVNPEKILHISQLSKGKRVLLSHNSLLKR